MEQQTLAMAADHTAHFEEYRKPTRRDKFLAAMGKRIPWAALCSVMQPQYLKACNSLNSPARPPIGLERMLRMHFVQHWFNVADEAGEDALVDSTALRRFIVIDLAPGRVPDATTLLKFRRRLEEHQLGQVRFAKVGEMLQASGLKVGAGATIIAAPSSTRYDSGTREPEMHQSRKGRQWHGDIAYASQQTLIASEASHARDMNNQRVHADGPGEDIARTVNRCKSRASSRVEHVFAVVRRLLGFNKACAIADWPRTPHGRLSRWGGPTSS